MDRKPSTSDLLLGLCVGLGLITVGVFAWQTASGPAEEPVSVALVEPAPPGGSLAALQQRALGEVERDPIVFPEGPDYDWVVDPVSGLGMGEAGEDAASADLVSVVDRGSAAPLAIPVHGVAETQAGADGADGADDAALRAYLRDMDFALQAGAWWTDANGLAQQVLSEAMSGQTASLVDLRKSNAAVAARVQAMSPPPEARTHHRKTLAVLKEGDTLLAGFERAVGSGDLEALASTAAAAERLQASAAEVDRLTEELSL